MREQYLPLLPSQVYLLYHERLKKARELMQLKKMGRPKAEKPKEIKYSIRTDADTERRLRAYCEAMGISRGEAYRKGIELLLEQSDEKG